MTIEEQLIKISENIPKIYQRGIEVGGGGVILQPLDNPASNDDILKSKQAFNSYGIKITGTIEEKTENDLSMNGPELIIPSGYYKENISKKVQDGSATANGTIKVYPTLSIQENGQVSASIDSYYSFTPDVVPGYISEGTEGSIKIEGNNSTQIDTKDGETYVPGTEDQKINKGVYLIEEQVIKGDQNLIAENIKKDVEIFNVVGSYETPAAEDLDEELDTQDQLIQQLRAILDTKAGLNSVSVLEDVYIDFIGKKRIDIYFLTTNSNKIEIKKSSGSSATVRCIKNSIMVISPSTGQELSVNCSFGELEEIAKFSTVGLYKVITSGVVTIQ